MHRGGDEIQALIRAWKFGSYGSWQHARSPSTDIKKACFRCAPNGEEINALSP